MTTMHDTAPLDLDEPIPYTLTPLAYAALAVDEPGPVEAAPLTGEHPPADEWSCQTCGAAYFGTRPDDGRCGDCRTTA